MYSGTIQLGTQTSRYIENELIKNENSIYIIAVILTALYTNYI